MGSVLSIKELEAIIQVKDADIERINENIKKKLTDSEEYQSTMIELEQRRINMAEMEIQFEEMYNKISSLEESKSSKHEDLMKINEELTSKLEEYERNNEDLIMKYEKLQTEYYIL